MSIFKIVTPFTYWLLIIIWFYIFVFYLRKLLSHKKPDKFLKVLLLILAIDSFRTLFESFYFGAWFTSLSEILPISVYNYLSQPQIVFFPKLFNLIVSILILVIIIRKWVPEEAERINNFEKEITNRTKKLKESEARFSSIIEQAGDAMFISDFEGNIHTVNKKACENLGYTREELVKLNISEIDSDPIDKIEFKKQWKDLVTGEVYTLETMHKRKNGKTFPVEVSFGVYNYSNKKSILGFARDITERKQAEDKIKQLNRELENKVLTRTTELEKKSKNLTDSQNALLNIVEDLNEKTEELEKNTAALESVNKELESFSYSVSHDLRAPLRGIDGFSLALLEDYSEILDDQGKSYLNRVRLGSQRMALLIDEMLNLSRLGRKALKPTTVNLSEIAQSISNDLREPDPQRPAEFIITKDILCIADPILIKAVMQNLLDNAWKFTSKKAKAKIEFGILDSEERKVYFVRDNGAGFNMDYKNKLFTPFQRLHQESEFPGTGIGLTTVQRIIHRHSGNIWAESEANIGATFYFTLNL